MCVNHIEPELEVRLLRSHDSRATPIRCLLRALKQSTTISTTAERPQLTWEPLVSIRISRVIQLLEWTPLQPSLMVHFELPSLAKVSAIKGRICLVSISTFSNWTLVTKFKLTREIVRQLSVINERFSRKFLFSKPSYFFVFFFFIYLPLKRWNSHQTNLSSARISSVQLDKRPLKLFMLL